MVDISDNFFKYSGKKYFFSVVLTTTLQNGLDFTAAVNNSCIQEFSYVTECNNLFLTGSLTCIDKLGKLDAFMQSTLSYCSVVMYEQVQRDDGALTIETIKRSNEFNHMFIIDNVEILNRAGETINYKMSLISSTWLNCVANIKYSNYKKPPQPIFDILKDCILSSKLRIDPISFKTVKTGVKLNYITNANDNLLTVKNFLFSKLYYQLVKDDSLKFLIYNEANDNYQLFDIKNKDTITAISTYSISFMNSPTETLTQQEPINIASVTKFPKSKLFTTFFHRNVYDFDYSTNKFENHPITPESIVGYINNNGPDNPYPKKYIFITSQDLEFKNFQSFWNNNLNIYDEVIDELTGDNSLVITVAGVLLSRPGAIVNISVDRNMANLETMSRPKLLELKSKYKSFEGPWISTKVRHIVKPSACEYRQNMVLTRSFANK